ncbi:phospholipase D-like domain-containing protein, partial [Vibrio cyclitrophicus]
NSTHWKLYLIEPNVVIIGSANFTALGVSLKRDTLVFLESEDLYNEYLTKVENLKSSPLVLNCQEKNFEHQFE